MTPPDLIPGHYGLFGITAPAPKDAWVVGDYVRAGRLKPVLEHWDGTSWTPAGPGVPLPPHTREAYFDTVDSSSASNVWAGGAFQTTGSGANHPLLEHYNGTKWKHVVVPASLGMDVILKVATSARKDVWVFGMNHECTSPDTFVYRWDGTNWTQAQTYNSCSTSGPPPTGPVVQALFSGGSNTAWALGYTFGGDPLNTPYSDCLGAHCPNHPAGCATGAFGQFLGGTGSGPDTWLTGWAKDPGTGTQQPLACHWNGAAWRDLSPPADVTTNRVFNAAAELPGGQVWAVGSIRPKSVFRNFAMRYTPGMGWQQMAFPSPDVSGEHEDMLTTIVHAAGTRHVLWAIDDNAGIFQHP